MSTCKSSPCLPVLFWSLRDHLYLDSFPLHPPAATQDALATTPSDAKSNEKEKKVALPEHLPILGHVSMLNTLALIPALPSTNGKQYIATGDRDEHVRISRFPMGHVIEGFLWGSKKWV